MNDEAKNLLVNHRKIVQHGPRSSGKLRVTFNKNVENLTNIDYNFGLNAEFNYATGTTNWSLTTLLEIKMGLVTNIPQQHTNYYR